MWYVGFCPACGQGTVGIRICGSGHHAVALCDECDAIWRSPELDAPATYAEQPGLPCPECGTSLLNRPAHWATRDEVQRIGWQDAILGEAPALGESPPGRQAPGRQAPGRQAPDSPSGPSC